MKKKQLYLNIVCEGMTDAPILRKIAEELGFSIAEIWEKGGSGNIKKYLASYNQAAQNIPHQPWFVVLDLDQKECAPSYARECLYQASPNMIFRIAVREIESWIMSDREHFAKFFRIPKEKIPLFPDEEINPKRKLVQLVKEYCNDKNIQLDIIPMGKAEFGRGYLSQIQKFLFGNKNTWRLEEGIKHSESLQKARERLLELL